MSTSAGTNGTTGVAETNGNAGPQDTTGEGVDLHEGVDGDGCAIPTGRKLNSLGLPVSADEERREWLEEEVAKGKEELKSARNARNRAKKVWQCHVDNAAEDKAAKALAVIGKHEAAIEEIQGKLREAEEQLKALPPE